ncbi:MAG TPA: hypothetical protein VFN61_11910 [Acidimicrobiales bacterium]|nr:hypothetical protein [Acidimicrobiales bacterium]
MPGMYLRGALVELVPTGLVPVPNVIIFQYNPETMTHSWQQPEQAPPGPNEAKSNPLAVQGSPGESFRFTISMDSNDTIADGEPTAGLAEVSGVYSRLSALEMLLYPSQAAGGALLGAVTAAVSSLGGGTAPSSQVPANYIPTCLFVWGPLRILPVRVTELTITERLYDAALNPVHAEAELGLRVMTPDELAHDSDTLAPLARACYEYTLGVRQAGAIANLANAAQSVVGMLPL